VTIGLRTRLAAYVTSFSGRKAGGRVQGRGVCAPGRGLPGCPQSGSRPSRKGPPLAPRPTPLAALSAQVGGGLERRPEAQQLQLRLKPTSLRTVPPLPKRGEVS
jgi:hypothetical protein